jgi:3-oxoacyl-[acyl-carrier-protein] synthase-1
MIVCLPAAEVLSVGMVTPVGLMAAPTAAAIRAGISRVKESNFLDKQLQRISAAFLDDEHLPRLNDSLTARLQSVTLRHQRMLRLAAQALHEAAPSGDSPIPLLLTLPEPQPWGDPIEEPFLEHLAEQARVKLELRQSQVFRQGRAGGLVAVERALELLATGRTTQVLVGAVDTYCDTRLLAVLDAEDRLKVKGLSDGFVPGEGAAFLFLGTVGEAKRQKRTPLARITSAGTGREPGHRYSTKPYLGEGLAQALRVLFERMPPQTSRIRCVYSGLNGESFSTKEWGVAYLRHSQYFETDFRIEHPAEFTGDPGAALGPMMLALAAIGIRKGYRQEPCLVWCSSDREERAAVMIQASTH